MYSTGTVTTTVNSTKLVGTNTKWLNNINRVSAEQAIQIQIDNTVHNNSIQSIQSDTELTLNFPLPTAATGAKYVILTTMVHSISDAMNKITAMQGANMRFSDILTRWMTEQGIITVTLPDQTTQQLRTTKEMDKQLDGKLDKAGGTLSNHLSVIGRVYTRSNATTNANEISIDALNTSGNCINSKRGTDPVTTHYLPTTTGTLMQVGDYGLGGNPVSIGEGMDLFEFFKSNPPTGFYRSGSNVASKPPSGFGWADYLWVSHSNGFGKLTCLTDNERHFEAALVSSAFKQWRETYTTANTTKDSNGNLKAASPVVKLFSDDIELNDESEGVEMEHLGVGHYLIKGVVGFNADGAWGINNGFVIPQDHNGKNMVLIDYEVRPDGDIEVFVFHQQNADMPERFQNKRIKHFDEEGVPVYFENYEPCDVPESRWIDMRVEMPPNSTYNQKQAEAERLAKLEAERLAQEEAERAEQEAAERKQYGLDENSVLL